jgi:hypothetical protein
VAVLFLAPVASAQNIVIVVIDDAGIERFGTYAVDYQLPGAAPTPTIDSLASTDVRFDNFWAYPYCSPFRASLLTGVGPWSHGVSDVVVLPNLDPERENGLDPEQMNIAHMLSNKGYRVEAFGKWHVAGLDAESTLHDVRQHLISSGFHLFDGSLTNSTQSVAEPPTPNCYGLLRLGALLWNFCWGDLPAGDHVFDHLHHGRGDHLCPGIRAVPVLCRLPRGACPLPRSSGGAALV